MFEQGKAYTAAMTVILSILTCAGIAQAHRVNVFAWQEGNHIVTQVYWANGKKAKGASVKVVNQQGDTIFTGKTSDKGLCSFTPPSRGSYRVSVNAGMGHAAESVVDFAPIATSVDKAPEATTGAGGKKADVNENAAPPQSDEPAIASAASASLTNTPACLTASQLESILDKQLKPVIRELAMLREEQSKVRPQDVIGGLGYILGIAGAAMYASGRKKNRT